MDYSSLEISPPRSPTPDKGLETGTKTSPAGLKMSSSARTMTPLDCGTCVCSWLWSKGIPCYPDAKHNQRSHLNFTAYWVHESLGSDWGWEVCGLGPCPVRFYTWPAKSYIEPNMRPVMMCRIYIYVHVYGKDIYACNTHTYIVFFCRFAKWFTRHVTVLKTEGSSTKVQLPNCSEGRSLLLSNHCHNIKLDLNL